MCKSCAVMVALDTVTGLVSAVQFLHRAPTAHNGDSSDLQNGCATFESCKVMWVRVV